MGFLVVVLDENFAWIFCGGFCAWILQDFCVDFCLDSALCFCADFLRAFSLRLLFGKNIYRLISDAPAKALFILQQRFFGELFDGLARARI